MKTYQEEIFGPVLQIVRAETFEEALALPSAHQYGTLISAQVPRLGNTSHNSRPPAKPAVNTSMVTKPNAA